MFLISILLIIFSRFALAADTIVPPQNLTDGRTLVSNGGSFELGFFSPGRSKSRYLGIWYKNIQVHTVVWVANRQNPINDTSGLLMINSEANLVLLSREGGDDIVVWSSNSTQKAQSPVAQLLDSGNLVIRDQNSAGNQDNFLWQSFDYPTDTLLPEMKLGWDLRTGLDRRLSAWKSPDDPSPGDFTWGIELYSYPDSIMWKGSKKYFRGAPWNGIGRSGSPQLKENPLFRYDFVSNEQEIYSTTHVENKSVITRLVLNQTNYLGERYVWNEEGNAWMRYSYFPRDNCDTYGACGAYESCDNTALPPCQCLKGFTLKTPQKGDLVEGSQGCMRNKPLDCKKGDGFIKFRWMKLPDTMHSWANESIGLKECRAKCLSNCSCMAYTNMDVRRKGSGCAIWFGDLIDMKQFQPGIGGQDLYIRMSSSESGVGDTRRMKTLMILTVIPLVLGIALISYYIYKIRANKRGREDKDMENEQSNERENEDLELQLFDLAIIAKATDEFSNCNKLGEGGFGPVYKGTMTDGQEIAVKRLSRSSGQGATEFKNEVALIAKLQHRNLVKLLGCCIQGDEKMLIYEYMPNKSLDFFIFDETRSKLLDWSKRLHIICGIARGLLYLHQDSRLRIIHRDLKASNVLLDREMNPKISDFGMARTFGGDETEGNTNRVVGTFGYMAPEYAIDGQFSVKSDVFSFGILLLEIISGKKNRGFWHPKNSLNLIGHAWRLWKEGKPMELIDSSLQDSCTLSEVIRCIHIGLLCVQQHPEDRPSMSSVVLMLGSATPLVLPKEPGFLMDKKSVLETDSSSSRPEFSSTNELSVTMLQAR